MYRDLASQVISPEGHFNSRDISAVWLRKIWSPIIETPMEERYRVAAVRESIVTRNALFQALDQAAWFDPIPKGQKSRR